MANIGMVFDATKVEPQGTASQLPVSDSKGWLVLINDSEMKETQAQDGSGFLELNLQIIEGEHAGTEGKYRLNIFNKNEKAQAIAHRQLSALCHVTGVMQISDSAMLHNRPFRAVVGLQKVKDGEEAKGFTEIKGVKDQNGNDPGKAGSAPAPQAAPPAPPQAPVAPAAPPQAPAPQWGAAPAPEAAPAAPQWGAPPAQPAAPAATNVPPWANKPA